MLSEFKGFVLRGNVLDLAVGLVAGAAFTGVVSSLVDTLVMPLIGIIFGVFGGQPDFAEYRLLAKVDGDWQAYTSATSATGGILIGAFLNALITFLATMAGLFFLVVKPANRLLEQMTDPSSDDDPQVRECPECLSSIPAAARRCAHCTAESAPILAT